MNSGNRESRARRKVGRRKQRTRGCWRHHALFERRVLRIMKSRDLADAETITEVMYTLEAFAQRRVLRRPLTDREQKRLRRLARDRRQAPVVNLLLSWRFALPDRTVRQLKRHKDIAVMRWA